LASSSGSGIAGPVGPRWRSLGFDTPGGSRCAHPPNHPGMGGASWPHSAPTPVTDNLPDLITAFPTGNCGFLATCHRSFAAAMTGRPLSPRHHLWPQHGSRRGGITKPAYESVSVTLCRCDWRHHPCSRVRDQSNSICGPYLSHASCQDVSAAARQPVPGQHMRKQAGLAPQDHRPAARKPVHTARMRPISGADKGPSDPLSGAVTIERGRRISSCLLWTALGTPETCSLMVSRAIPASCFAAGEMLDWEAPTGRFIFCSLLQHRSPAAPTSALAWLR